MPILTLRVSSRDLGLHRTIIAPQLGARTVLTDSPWGFVALWLKRERKDLALFFWNQAKEFYAASLGMTAQTAPLLLYYSFMNSAKALLASKGVPFDPIHGVGAANTRKPTDKIVLSNETVRIKNRGVLPALSLYLGENERLQVHSLQDILFNLPYVHRTYCHTYKSQRDMFIPLTDCLYVYDTNTRQAFLRATLSKDFAGRRLLRRLPPSLIADQQCRDARAIRSASSAPMTGRNLRSTADLAAIAQLNRRLRADIQYVKGSQALWYVKGNVSGPKRLGRFPLTLTLAAMHRLSEVCRYKILS